MSKKSHTSFLKDALSSVSNKIIDESIKKVLEGKKAVFTGPVPNDRRTLATQVENAISGKKADLLILDDIEDFSAIRPSGPAITNQNPCAEIPLPAQTYIGFDPATGADSVAAVTVQRPQAVQAGQLWEMVAVSPKNHPIPPQITTWEGKDLSANPEAEPGLHIRQTQANEIIVSGYDKQKVEELANRVRQSHKTMTFAQMYGGLGGHRRSAMITSVAPLQNSFANLAQAAAQLGFTMQDFTDALSPLTKDRKKFDDLYLQSWPESKVKPWMIITGSIKAAQEMIRHLPEHERRRVPIISEPTALKGRNPHDFHIAVHPSFHRYEHAEKICHELLLRAASTAMLRDMPNITVRDGENFLPLRQLSQVSNLRFLTFPEDVIQVEIREAETLDIRVDYASKRHLETVRVLKSFPSGLVLCDLANSEVTDQEILPEDDIDLSEEL